MAINAQMIKGEWNRYSSLAKKHWNQLTEEDLKMKDGNFDDLFGRIQQKTGEGREAVEKFFNDLTSHASENTSHAVESAGEYVHQVGDKIRERYDDAEGMVRRHPTETVVAVFGIGLVAGLIAGLVIRHR